MGWMPHGHCWFWDPWLIAIQVAANLAIASAYFTIPATLFRMWLLNGNRNFRVVPLLFGSFIVLCGLTHLMDVICVWVPAYRTDTVIRVATAVVSVATALIFRPVADTIARLQRRVHELEEELRGR